MQPDYGNINNPAKSQPADDKVKVLYEALKRDDYLPQDLDFKRFSSKISDPDMAFKLFKALRDDDYIPKTTTFADFGNKIIRPLWDEETSSMDQLTKNIQLRDRLRKFDSYVNQDADNLLAKKNVNKEKLSLAQNAWNSFSKATLNAINSIGLPISQFQESIGVKDAKLTDDVPLNESEPDLKRNQDNPEFRNYVNQKEGLKYFPNKSDMDLKGRMDENRKEFIEKRNEIEESLPTNSTALKDINPLENNIGSVFTNLADLTLSGLAGSAPQIVAWAANPIAGAVTSYSTYAGDVYADRVLNNAEKKGLSVSDYIDKGLDKSDANAALLAAAPLAALDKAGADVIIGQIRNLVRKNGVSAAKGLFGRMREIGKAGALEGTTEASQETIQQFATKGEVDPESVALAGIGGALGGATIGGLSNLAQAASNAPSVAARERFGQESINNNSNQDATNQVGQQESPEFKREGDNAVLQEEGINRKLQAQEQQQGNETGSSNSLQPETQIPVESKEKADINAGDNSKPNLTNTESGNEAVSKASADGFVNSSVSAVESENRVNNIIGNQESVKPVPEVFSASQIGRLMFGDFGINSIFDSGKSGIPYSPANKTALIQSENNLGSIIKSFSYAIDDKFSILKDIDANTKKEIQLFAKEGDKNLQDAFSNYLSAKIRKGQSNGIIDGLIKEKIGDKFFNALNTYSDLVSNNEVSIRNNLVKNRVIEEMSNKKTFDRISSSLQNSASVFRGFLSKKNLSEVAVRAHALVNDAYPIFSAVRNLYAKKGIETDPLRFLAAKKEGKEILSSAANPQYFVDALRRQHSAQKIVEYGLKSPDGNYYSNNGEPMNAKWLNQPFSQYVFSLKEKNPSLSDSEIKRTLLEVWNEAENVMVAQRTLYYAEKLGRDTGLTNIGLDGKDVENANKILSQFEEFKQTDKLRHEAISSFLERYRLLGAAAVNSMVDYGRITKEKAKEILAHQDSYASLNRWFADNISDDEMHLKDTTSVIFPVDSYYAQGVFSNSDKSRLKYGQLKKIKGGYQTINSPTENLFLLVNRINAANNANYFLLNFIKGIESINRDFYSNDGASGFGEVVRKETAPKQGKDVKWLTAYENGKPVSLSITDKSLINAFENIQKVWWLNRGISSLRKSIKAETNPILRLAKDAVYTSIVSPSKIVRQFITLNPKFKFNQFFYDLNNNITSSGKLDPISWFKSTSEILTSFDKTMEKLDKADASFTWNSMSNEEQIRYALNAGIKDIVKFNKENRSDIKLFLDWQPLSNTNKFAKFNENIQRNSIYDAAYKVAKNDFNLSEEESIMYAAHMARDFFDYSAGTVFSRGISSFVPFFNATVVGLDKSIRLGKARPGQYLSMILMMFVLKEMAQYLILNAFGDDEQRKKRIEIYKEQIPETAKNMGVVIPTDDGKNFTVIPLAQGPSTTPWIILRKFFDYHVLNDKNAFDRSPGDNALQEIFGDALKSILPPVSSTTIDLFNSNDSFTGQPAIPESEKLQKLEVREGVVNANQLSKDIASVGDRESGEYIVDPRQIDFFVNKLGGSLARNANFVYNYYLGEGVSANKGLPVTNQTIYSAGIVNTISPFNMPDYKYIKQWSKEMNIPESKAFSGFSKIIKKLDNIASLINLGSKEDKANEELIEQYTQTVGLLRDVITENKKAFDAIRKAETKIAITKKDLSAEAIRNAIIIDNADNKSYMDNLDSIVSRFDKITGDILKSTKKQ